MSLTTTTTPVVDEDEVVPAVPDAARRALPGGDVARQIAFGLAGVAVVVAVWAVLTRTEVLNPDYVPGPFSVGDRIFDLIGSSDFRSAVVSTVRTWLWSMVVAGVVAIPVGLVVGHVRWLERPVGFVVDAARSVPSTALIPVAIIVWGLGDEMKMALIIYAVFWPLLINAMYGAHSVDPVMKSVARSLRWGSFTTLRRVVLPAAAPSIATGIRVSAAIGLIVVLSAELLGATSGIGTEMMLYQQANQPDFVYAGIVLIGVLGMLVAGLLALAERILVPWSNANRRR